MRRVFKPSVLEVRHAARWAINQAYADIVGPEAEPVSELIAMDAWTVVLRRTADSTELRRRTAAIATSRCSGSGSECCPDSDQSQLGHDALSTSCRPNG